MGVIKQKIFYCNFLDKLLRKKTNINIFIQIYNSFLPFNKKSDMYQQHSQIRLTVH